MLVICAMSLSRVVIGSVSKFLDLQSWKMLKSRVSEDSGCGM